MTVERVQFVDLHFFQLQKRALVDLMDKRAVQIMLNIFSGRFKFRFDVINKMLLKVYSDLHAPGILSVSLKIVFALRTLMKRSYYN